MWSHCDHITFHRMEGLAASNLLFFLLRRPVYWPWSVTLLTFIYGILLTTGSWAPGRGVYEIKKGDSDLTKELKNEIYGEGLRLARTMTMHVIVMAELLRAYTSRSLRSSLCQVGTFSNKYMHIFRRSSRAVHGSVLQHPRHDGSLGKSKAVMNESYQYRVKSWNGAV